MTVVIGKTIHPKGTNCGTDAYRVVRHLHGALAGSTAKIHLSRSASSWSWKGTGLVFCSEREITRLGKVLWNGHTRTPGTHATTVDPTGSWIEVRARRA